MAGELRIQPIEVYDDPVSHSGANFLGRSVPLGSASAHMQVTRESTGISGQFTETLRSALNALATADPDWLSAHVDPAWVERYGRRIEDGRLPKGKEARIDYLKTVGADGLRLLASLAAPDTPHGLAELAEVDLLRRCWAQQFTVSKGKIRILDPQEMPEAAQRIESPYEVEARYAIKGPRHWVGYKVHLTETCDAGLPHLITHVHTTPATGTDVKQLCAIQDGLADSGLLPAEHLADAAYVCGSNLVASHARQIDLIGPTYEDRTWQAKQADGFDLASFRVDWDTRMVICPRGRQSSRWSETQTARGRRMIHIDFAPDDCTPCPSRSSCTRAKHLPRSLTLQPKDEHEAIQAARQRQQTEAFTALYAQRAGIEGTISQGVRAFGARQARYRGLKRTHLQQVATAAAVNVGRIVHWLNGVPLATTRQSRFTALAPGS